MPRTYKSPIDGKIFLKIPDLVEYTKMYHLDKIPKEYKGNVEQYLYDYRNGKGHCQVCGAPTAWNDEKKRYEILCKPGYVNGMKIEPNGKVNTCFEVWRKRYVNNIKNKYGKENLMEDIDYINMLLANRKIAKVTKFKNKEITVIGSYELEFVNQCNKVLSKESDLHAPGPEISYTVYGENLAKRTIVDFYIKSIDAIISIKDAGYHNEDHESIKNKRKVDAYKFYHMIHNKKRYRCVLELNGMEEIKDFPNLYKKIKEFFHNNPKERYIKYPFYYFDYIKEK